MTSIPLRWRDTLVINMNSVYYASATPPNTPVFASHLDTMEFENIHHITRCENCLIPTLVNNDGPCPCKDDELYMDQDDSDSEMTEEEEYFQW